MSAKPIKDAINKESDLQSHVSGSTIFCTAQIQITRSVKSFII